MKYAKPLLLTILGLLISSHLSAKPNIVASIRPLALITEDLLGDLVTVEQLLPSTASPHHYALKVSDRRKLQQADLIIWMGPEFERFLAKPLASVTDNQKLALVHSEAHETSEGNDEDHRQGSDPHRWLDPKNVIVMSRTIAGALGSQYPELQQGIANRLAEQERRLRELDQQLTIKLFPYQNRSFIADHDAYQSIANAYSLNQLAAVMSHTDIAPSAQHLKYLDGLVKEKLPRCLLVESGQKSPALARWAERWQLQIVTIDILGLQTEIDSYRALMGSIEESLVTCLE